MLCERIISSELNLLPENLNTDFTPRENRDPCKNKVVLPIRDQ